MNFIFHTLTDIALRRVYKFVLKQAIGKYLKDELIIDQLHVHSRDGLVTVSDLELNVDVLNRELFGLPIRLLSAKISFIEVHMSYSTILTDSCLFVIDSIDCVVDNQINSNFDTTHSTKAQETIKTTTPVQLASDDDQAEREISAEGEEGLNFIAQWIELVVAKLRIEIRTINLVFEHAGRRLSLQLRDIQFSSNDSSSFASQQSLEASTRLMNSLDLAASYLSAAKVCRISFAVCLMFSNNTLFTGHNHRRSQYCI
jgi:hypothetical protein